ncbi:hypothetical protein FGG08_004008 [Glutinoglossum americanum]|uniref:Rhodanese domain-containing protein n=1 Tax=Glutinoglossum americanum TaxID=1670608 RepID=A0A9P8I1I2_9PEZI|nr:hypothetical protein FGG08_004008 [Glutinoglossum americanum]
MEWLRHEEYASIPWVLLLGPIDSDWISFVKSKGQTMFPYDGKFADPHYCGQFVETGHLFATMNAVYLKPPLEYPFVNRGDFGGWGGDLATLFGDWLAASKLPAYNFSYDRVRGNTGSFKLLDTIEDADGFNMAMTLVSDPGSTIYEVAAEYYKPAGGYRSRFSKFFKTRFRDRDRASSLAHEMLTANGNISPTEEEGVELRALRAGAILKVAGLKNVKNLPGNLPITELQPFYDGFVDALIELTQDKGNDC